MDHFHNPRILHAYHVLFYSFYDRELGSLALCFNRRDTGRMVYRHCHRSNKGTGTRGPFELHFALNKGQISDAPFFVPIGLNTAQLNFCIGLIVDYNQVEWWKKEKEVRVNYEELASILKLKYHSNHDLLYA